MFDELPLRRLCTKTPRRLPAGLVVRLSSEHLMASERSVLHCPFRGFDGCDDGGGDDGGFARLASHLKKTAVSGLSNDHEVLPEDGTAEDTLRDAKSKLGEDGDMNVPQQYSASQPIEDGEGSLDTNELDMKSPISDAEALQGSRGNLEDTRPAQNYVLGDDHNSMAAYAALGGVPEEMVKAAVDMLSNIEPRDFLKMLEVASSLHEKGSSFDTVGEESRSELKIPETTHEMLNLESAGISEIPQEEFQKMISMLNMNGLSSPSATEDSICRRSNIGSSVAAGYSDIGNLNAGESKICGFLSDYATGQSSLSIPSSDLSTSHEVSPDILTDTIRDTSSILEKDSGDLNAPRKMVEEAHHSTATNCNSSSFQSVEQPVEVGQCSQSANESCLSSPKSDAECLQSLGDDAEAIRLTQNDAFNCDLDSLAALGTGGIPAEIIKTATDMISYSDPEELQKMLEVAFSLNVKGPIFNTISSPSRLGFDFQDISLEMIKMASDRVSKMSPEELQKMLEVAPLVNMNVIFSPRPASTQRSKSCSAMSALVGNSATGKFDTEGILSSGSRLNSKMSQSSSLRLNSKMSQSSSCLPTTVKGFPENMRYLPNDPANQQMFTYMVKDMNPKIMTSMSEQTGLNLPCGESVEPQQAMSPVSEDDLDAMTLQDKRAQGPETMEKTTIWFIGKAGLNLAICMMLLAFLFHKLGYIRG